jgi:ParB family chromosome partitioning protein
MKSDVERTRSSWAPTLASISLEPIDCNLGQPRETFSQNARLAASLISQGMLQPIIVRPTANRRYQIVAGERRWCAAQIAGWSKLPALVRYLTDAAAAEISLAENELRVQVNRIEIARAAQAMVDGFGHTHEKLGAILAIRKLTISNDGSQNFYINLSRLTGRSL